PSVARREDLERDERPCELFVGPVLQKENARPTGGIARIDGRIRVRGVQVQGDSRRVRDDLRRPVLAPLDEDGHLLLAADPNDLPPREGVRLDRLVRQALVIEDAPRLDRVRREGELVERPIAHGRYHSRQGGYGPILAGSRPTQVAVRASPLS